MADSTIAINKLLKWEGGKVDDPVDPGGKTNFGITQKSLDAYLGTFLHSTLPADVFALTREQAIQFYLIEYWAPLRGSQIAHQPLADLLLSMAVLQGRRTAVRRLQALLGLPRDGSVGLATLVAIAKADSALLLKRYADACESFFLVLIERRPALAKFQRGWFARVEDYA